MERAKRSAAGRNNERPRNRAIDSRHAKYKQAVTAAGMGCRAARDAERYLAARGVH